jgi:hypothetical protein
MMRPPVTALLGSNDLVRVLSFDYMNQIAVASLRPKRLNEVLALFAQSCRRFTAPAVSPSYRLYRVRSAILFLC